MRSFIANDMRIINIEKAKADRGKITKIINRLFILLIVCLPDNTYIQHGSLKVKK